MDKNEFLDLGKYPPIKNGHKVKSFVTNPYQLRSTEILVLERCIGFLKFIDNEDTKIRKGLETFLDDGSFTIGPFDELSDKIVDFLCEYFQIDTNKMQNPIWEYVYDNSLGKDGDIHTMEELLDAIISFNDPESITESEYKSGVEGLKCLIEKVDEDELTLPKHCTNCKYFQKTPCKTIFSCVEDECEVLTMVLDEKSGTNCAFFKPVC